MRGGLATSRALAAVAATAVVVFWLGAPAAWSQARADVRVLVPGLVPESEAKGPEKLLEKAGARCAPLGDRKLDAEAIASADAVLLDERSLEALAQGGEDAAGALEGAVAKGLDLVVVGAAAAALPGSARYSALLGRRVHGRDGLRGIAIEIPDQSHPATQCVTHLWLARATLTCRGVDGVTALARARLDAGDAPPVFWTRAAGAGSVTVLALEAPEAAARERGALAFLAARALEWAASGRVTLWVPEDMPLAAERLGPADASTLPGLAPEKGFYRGRQVAPVMGYQAADWLLRHDREETEQPEKVLEALAIAEGATVADVGAGAGYFTLRLARRVGPTGRVLATDLQEEMLELLRGRIAEAGLKNVEAVLATETDPKLPEGAVDLALLVDVYHELARPAEALAGLRKSLRPAADGKRPGRLVLVEYRGEDPSVPIKALHRTTVQQVRSEIEPAGFKLVEVKGFLPHQHVLVFERR